MFKRGLVLVLVLLLLVILVATGCSSPSPSPAPAPAPAKTTAAPAATTSPAAAQHPIVKLSILTSKMGSTGYSAAFALADLVSKNHPWLRITAMETAGTADVCNLMYKMTPDDRKNTIASGTDSVYLDLKNGEKQFVGKATDVRPIANYAFLFSTIVTTNQNLKTKADLIGKRISSGDTKGSASSQGAEYILTGWDIIKQVRLDYLAADQTWEALGDGLIDAAYASGTLTADKSKAILDAPLLELTTTKKIYIIPFSQEDWQKAFGIIGFHKKWVELQPGQVMPNTPDKVTGALSSASNFVAPREVPDEVTYELAKFIYNNTDKFIQYYAQGAAMYKGMLTRGSWTPDTFHPGAAKYWKEMGIKMGD